MIELTPGEKVHAMIRKHWLVIAQDIVVLGGVILTPFILYIVLHITPVANFLHIEGSHLFLGLLLGSLWLLIFWTIFFVAWTDYYLDILIITDERIFDIEQKGLFNRDSSEFRHDRIQDVTVEVKGILPTVFKFGHIHIQTASEQREFVARYIPNPYKVKELIMHNHDRAMQRLQVVQIRDDIDPDAK